MWCVHRQVTSTFWVTSLSLLCDPVTNGFVKTFVKWWQRKWEALTVYENLKNLCDTVEHYHLADTKLTFYISFIVVRLLQKVHFLYSFSYSKLDFLKSGFNYIQINTVCLEFWSIVKYIPLIQSEVYFNCFMDFKVFENLMVIRAWMCCRTADICRQLWGLLLYR